MPIDNNHKYINLFFLKKVYIKIVKNKLDL